MTEKFVNSDVITLVFLTVILFYVAIFLRHKNGRGLTQSYEKSPIPSENHKMPSVNL